MATLRTETRLSGDIGVSPGILEVSAGWERLAAYPRRLPGGVEGPGRFLRDFTQRLSHLPQKDVREGDPGPCVSRRTQMGIRPDHRNRHRLRTRGDACRKQYASEGKAIQLTGDWFDVRETIYPGSTSELMQYQSNHRVWVRTRLTIEQYFKKGFYSSGYLLEGVFSNQPTFSNYYGTIINAPGFYPLQDSKTILLQKFRAFNYVAGGWRNVFSLRKNLDFRLEAYAFKPLQTISQDDKQRALVEEEIQQFYFAGMADLVMHTTVGPISLSLNYYDDPNRQLSVLLHVGFLLFNKTSLE